MILQEKFTGCGQFKTRLSPNSDIPTLGLYPYPRKKDTAHLKIDDLFENGLNLMRKRQALATHHRLARQFNKEAPVTLHMIKMLGINLLHKSVACSVWLKDAINGYGVTNISKMNESDYAELYNRMLVKYKST